MVLVAIPNGVTPGAGVSHFKRPASARGCSHQERTAHGQQSEIPREVVTAIVQSSERLEGAASILAMLEEKADTSGEGVKSSELAAVRSIVEMSVNQLDEAWEEV